MTNASIFTYDEIVAHLSSIVGPHNVITERGEVRAASLDTRGRRQGDALLIVRPASTEETSAVMKFAAEARLVVIVQGGNTSNVGGATPTPIEFDTSGRNARTIIVQTRRMNKIRSLDPIDNTAHVEAGVILANLQKAADDAGRLFPLSLSAEGSAQMGGILGANAGGVHVLRYGMARNLTLGIKVVLADGEILDLMRSVRKDNAGYDLIDLFIGSEGTLGIITEAVVKLEAKPLGRTTVLASLAELQAVENIFQAVEGFAGPLLTAYELISQLPFEIALKDKNRMPPLALTAWLVLFDLSWFAPEDEARLAEKLETELGTLIETGLIADAIVSTSETEAADLWAIREEIPGAIKRTGGNIKNDISIPRANLVTFIKETFADFAVRFPWMAPCIFGHYGDGNLHFNLGAKPEFGAKYAFRFERDVHRAVNDAVVKYRGSIAAEHGIGELRVEEMKRLGDPVELKLMSRLKALFDPEKRLNPGRAIPS